jgi:hypothetical protein
MSNETPSASTRPRVFPYLLFGLALATLVVLFVAVAGMMTRRARSAAPAVAAEESSNSAGASREDDRAQHRRGWSNTMAPFVPEQSIDPRDHSISREEGARRELAVAIHELERSGPGSPSWTSKTTQAIEGWMRALPGAKTAQFSPIRCFDRGCTLTITRRPSDFTAADVSDNPEGARPAFWMGPYLRSGMIPVPPDKFQITWIFYQDT